MQVQLWTPSTGLVKGDRPVLETLAATNPLEEENTSLPENYPLIWLTQNSGSLSSLPLGSRWVLWENISSLPTPAIVNRDYPGIILQSEAELQLQLQKPLNN